MASAHIRIPDAHRPKADLYAVPLADLAARARTEHLLARRDRVRDRGVALQAGLRAADGRGARRAQRGRTPSALLRAQRQVVAKGGRGPEGGCSFVRLKYASPRPSHACRTSASFRDRMKVRDPRPVVDILADHVTRPAWRHAQTSAAVAISFRASCMSPSLGSESSNGSTDDGLLYSVPVVEAVAEAVLGPHDLARPLLLLVPRHQHGPASTFLFSIGMFPLLSPAPGDPVRSRPRASRWCRHTSL